jgi:hypothetical protein
LRDACCSLRADSVRIEATFLPDHAGKDSTGGAFLPPTVLSGRQVPSAVVGWANGSWSSLAVDGAAFPLLSCVAGVAPACALAGVLAKASANASSGPTIRSIVVSFWFDDGKTRGAADWCRRQTLKEKLSPHFWVFGIFKGVLLHA